MLSITKRMLALAQFSTRLSIFRKISYGYGLSIGIAILGTSIGLVIGNQAAEKAQQHMLIADAQETLLSDLTATTLSIRMHPQRLLAVVEDSIWFQYETSKFTNDVNQAKELLAELNTFAERYPSQLAVETDQLEEFLQTYTQTIEANSQFIELLWQQIDPRLTSAEETAQAPQQILAALNEDATIKLRLEFDRLSENLIRIKQAALSQQTAANDQLAQANALRLHVIVFSMILSAVMSIVLAIVSSRAIARPIQTLNQVAQRSVQESNFDLQAPITTHDEIGTLSNSFNQLIDSVKHLLQQQQAANDQLELYNHTLEQKVEERTQELSEKNEHLNQLLEELRRTQSQMVQSEKMSSLGQLVAGVAHEINNPVNFIHGNIVHVNDYAQDLLKLIEIYQQHCSPLPATLQPEIDEIDLDFVTEDLPKILRSMQVGTERIREIVRSLRNFSRLDEAEFKAVDIHEGIDNTLMILWHRLKARTDRPEIQVIKEYAQLPLIECYAGQLNQVFMNLLANAIDALEDSNNNRSFKEIAEHPNLIHIRTQQIDSNRISITISDNGHGISEANQAHLFNPFFTTKPVGKGTGLGLSISYQIIVEKHHGRMSCNSQLGQGTTFTIEIPVCQPATDHRVGAPLQQLLG